MNTIYMYLCCKIKWYKILIKVCPIMYFTEWLIISYILKKDLIYNHGKLKLSQHLTLKR
jgi:hypothetical protein